MRAQLGRIGPAVVCSAGMVIAAAPAAAAAVDSASMPFRVGPPSGAAVAGLQDQNARRRPGNPPADLVFSGSTATDGSIVIEGRTGELTFRKKVFQNGTYTLDISTPRDRVALAAAERVVTIRRGRRAITVDLAATGDDDLDRARRLIADSRAIRLFRGAAAALQEAEDDGAAAVSVMASDALIGVITGDVGAPGRAARHFSRRHRARLRSVALSTDCYKEWETRVLIASYEWEDCAMAISPWNPTVHLCAARWLLQIEVYWFSMISCTGFQGVFGR